MQKKHIYYANTHFNHYKKPKFYYLYTQNKIDKILQKKVELKIGRAHV